MEPKRFLSQTWHFDIDSYLNPIIPSNRLDNVQPLLSRVLGYRVEPVQEYGNIIIALWTLLSTYVALLLVALIFKLSPWIQSLHPPVLIGSLGAAAILEYNALSSPLAQPRNALFGHVISAIVGVAVAQALDSSAGSAYLLAPLACGLASAAMSLTGTVHPPGGATAVLAVTDSGLRALGWSLVPLVIVACIIMVVVACIMGNILRRYPYWWWTAGKCGARWERNNQARDLEALSKQEPPHDEKCDQRQLSRPVSGESLSMLEKATVLVSEHGLLYPPDFHLSDKELLILEGLAARLELRSHKKHVGP